MERVKGYAVRGALAFVVVILLVAVGTAYAIISSQHHADTSTSQVKDLLARQQALIAQQQSELHASCKFWEALAGIDVQPPPPTPKPSKLGVSIVADSRIAFLGQSCGQIPDASPSLEKWAAYYHLPLK